MHQTQHHQLILLLTHVAAPCPLLNPTASPEPLPTILPSSAFLTDGSPRQRAQKCWGRVWVGFFKDESWIASHSLPCTAAIRSVLQWQPVGHLRNPRVVPLLPVNTSGYQSVPHRLFGTILAEIPLQGPQPITIMLLLSTKALGKMNLPVLGSNSLGEVLQVNSVLRLHSSWKHLLTLPFHGALWGKMELLPQQL